MAFISILLFLKAFYLCGIMKRLPYLRSIREGMCLFIDLDYTTNDFGKAINIQPRGI